MLCLSSAQCANLCKLRLSFGLVRVSLHAPPLFRLDARISARFGSFSAWCAHFCALCLSHRLSTRILVRFASLWHRDISALRLSSAQRVSLRALPLFWLDACISARFASLLARCVHLCALEPSLASMHEPPRMLKPSPALSSRLLILSSVTLCCCIAYIAWYLPM